MPAITKNSPLLSMKSLICLTIRSLNSNCISLCGEILTELPKLKSFDFRFNFYDILKKLSSQTTLPNLTTASIGNLSTIEEWEKFSKIFFAMEDVSFFWNGDFSIVESLKSFKNLRRLKIANKTIDFDPICDLLTAVGSRLERLGLTAGKLALDDLQIIIQSCTSLKELILESLLYLSEDDIDINLDAQLENLRILRFNSLISPVALQFMLSHAPNLTTLHYIQSPSLNNVVMKAINEGALRKLQKITVQGHNCDLLPLVRTAVEKCPDFKDLRWCTFNNGYDFKVKNLEDVIRKENWDVHFGSCKAERSVIYSRTTCMALID